jgi:hypothetical protein
MVQGAKGWCLSLQRGHPEHVTSGGLVTAVILLQKFLASV